MNIELDGVSLDLGFVPAEHHEKLAEQIKSAWETGVSGLKRKNAELINDVKAARESAKHAGEGQVGELASQLTSAQEKATNLENELQIVQHNLDQAQKKSAEFSADAEKWQGKHGELVKSTGLTQELAKIGVSNPALLDGSRALLMGQVSQGEDGSLKMGDKDLSEALKEWSETDAGKAFVGTGGNAGGDAGGGKPGGYEGKNPWAKDSFSLTEQMRVAGENPELAKQLEAAA